MSKQSGSDAPEWMKPAGIISVALGVLGFWASASVGGGGSSEGAILAGLLNPLFFVGVPLGIYWLNRTGFFDSPAMPPGSAHKPTPVSPQTGGPPMRTTPSPPTREPAPSSPPAQEPAASGSPALLSRSQISWALITLAGFLGFVLGGVVVGFVAEATYQSGERKPSTSATGRYKANKPVNDETRPSRAYVPAIDEGEAPQATPAKRSTIKTPRRQDWPSLESYRAARAVPKPDPPKYWTFGSTKAIVQEVQGPPRKVWPYLGYEEWVYNGFEKVIFDEKTDRVIGWANHSGGLLVALPVNGQIVSPQSNALFGQGSTVKDVLRAQGTPTAFRSCSDYWEWTYNSSDRVKIDKSSGRVIEYSNLSGSLRVFGRTPRRTGIW